MTYHGHDKSDTIRCIYKTKTNDDIIKNINRGKGAYSNIYNRLTKLVISIAMICIIYFVIK